MIKRVVYHCWTSVSHYPPVCFRGRHIGKLHSQPPDSKLFPGCRCTWSESITDAAYQRCKFEGWQYLHAQSGGLIVPFLGGYTGGQQAMGRVLHFQEEMCVGVPRNGSSVSFIKCCIFIRHTLAPGPCCSSQHRIGFPITFLR